ncbi:MAG: hypothetical protein MZU95_13160 [Desulfomicrobium escambiense]|nr:hypothetical protein [Desulfomicrobium escambiense]
MTIGLDHYRTAMLLALVEKKAGYSFAGEDIYLNVAGGMTIEEPAVDLGVVMAVVSSLKNAPLPQDMAFFGEVGLSRRDPLGRPAARPDQGGPGPGLRLRPAAGGQPGRPGPQGPAATSSAWARGPSARPWIGCSRGHPSDPI